MKITKSKSIFFLNTFICLVLLNPQAISQVSWLDSTSSIIRLLIFFFLCSRWLFKRKFKRYQIALIVLFGSRLLATFINNDEIVVVFTLFFPIITVMLLLERNKDRIPILIKSIYAASALLIIINAITVFSFPTGLYTSNYGHTPLWIIGQKQDWNTAYISFFMASIILWNEKKTRIISYIVYTSMLYTFTQQFPLGLILYFVVVLGLLFISKKKKILTAKGLFLTNAIFEIIVIIIAFNFDKMLWLNNLLSSISAGEVMTKQDTILQRIYMWKDGLAAFIEKPILGVGYVSSDRWVRLFHLSSYHPNFHNTPIDILVTSGLIGLVAYIVIYNYSAKKLDKSKSRHSVLITYGIFGINILMLTEGVYAPFIWFFIFLGIYIDRLDASIESSEYSLIERKQIKNEVFNLHRPGNR